MSRECLVIGIDGPACSGKGTVAKRFAKEFHFHHLDSGLLYRAVTLELLRSQKDLTDPEDAIGVAQRLTPEMLHQEGLHGEAVNRSVSAVAAIPEVRAALLEFQRNFPREPGAVIDGRDIGTTIFPQAEVKLFITASPEVRAGRALSRLSNLAFLRGGNVRVSYDELLAGILERDRQDAEREHSPMRQAEDAILIDTTHLDKEGAYSAVRAACLGKLAGLLREW